MSRPLRIAQVAPLFASVPPERSGGTERVVHHLTEALVELGHDVTLFASGDSRTRARLIAPCALALGPDRCAEANAHHLAMLESVYRRWREFDIVHFHLGYIHFAATRRLQLPHVTTLHGRLDLPELGPLYAEYSELPMVSISRAQRSALPEACWVGNVPLGLPLDAFPLAAGGDYLVFLGGVSPEHGLDRAIEIARRADRRLVVAAEIGGDDQSCYEEHLVPLLAQPHVDWRGEIGDADKRALLGGALALVIPVAWPDPSGLVMVEAMACGTPVIGWRDGSVAEIVDDGRTGAIVDSLDAAVAAVDRVARLPRDGVRARFEARFSSARMALDYVALYRQLTFREDDDARARPGDRGLLPSYGVAPG